MSNRRYSEEVVKLAAGAASCLERIRSGDRGSLTEMKQFWGRLKATGASNGAPAVTVLGSALEALSESWQRARAAGREHPDSARLIQEALDLLPGLLQPAAAPPGGGTLKSLCARAAELTETLSRSTVTAPEA